MLVIVPLNCTGKLCAHNYSKNGRSRLKQEVCKIYLQLNHQVIILVSLVNVWIWEVF